MSRKTSKRTKILCTIGPASDDKETMYRMYQTGMDGVRINIAHGDFEQYEKIVRIAREISDSLPILLDIKGPEIRAKVNAPIELKKNKKLVVGFEKHSADIYITYDFFDSVKNNDIILFSNGLIKTKVVDKNTKDRTLSLKVLTEGTLENNKGVNVPNIHLDIPSLSEKDIKAVDWAVKKALDFIALSFCRCAKDVENLRKLIEKDIHIIAKIENQEGVNNIEEILNVADGIMIARGDLGAEIGIEHIPIIQKNIIQQCINHGKLSITATQMLETMTSNPIPTRAEVSDVANAVLDGTDCLMLSGETAIGKYPIESVRTMAKIVKRIEREIPEKRLTIKNKKQTISEVMSKAIPTLARELNMSKIIALTRSGFTARMISRFRMDRDIFAITSKHKTYRQLNLYFGITPIKMPDAKQTTYYIAKHLFSKKLINKNETIIFSAGTYEYRSHHSNMIEVHATEDLLKLGEQKRHYRN